MKSATITLARDYGFGSLTPSCCDEHRHATARSIWERWTDCILERAVPAGYDLTIQPDDTTDGQVQITSADQDADRDAIRELVDAAWLDCAPSADAGDDWQECATGAALDRQIAEMLGEDEASSALREHWHAEDLDPECWQAFARALRRITDRTGTRATAAEMLAAMDAAGYEITDEERRLAEQKECQS